MCAECHFKGQVGTEVKVGLFHVRSGREWNNIEVRDAGDCDGKHLDLLHESLTNPLIHFLKGNLQDGGHGDEDARR